jgi:hypothetical protein
LTGGAIEVDSEGRRGSQEFGTPVHDKRYGLADMGVYI